MVHSLGIHCTIQSMVGRENFSCSVYHFRCFRLIHLTCKCNACDLTEEQIIFLGKIISRSFAPKHKHTHHIHCLCLVIKMFIIFLFPSLYLCVSFSYAKSHSIQANSYPSRFSEQRYTAHLQSHPQHYTRQQQKIVFI